MIITLMIVIIMTIKIVTIISNSYNNKDIYSNDDNDNE